VHSHAGGDGIRPRPRQVVRARSSVLASTLVTP
jgi:hypothetical protein